MRKKINADYKEEANKEIRLTEIKYLIKSYYTQNNRLNLFKKQAEKDKNTIKNYFIENELEELQADDIMCTISKSDRTTFNEEAAIEILKKNIDENILSNIIKTKEYIDEDALEKAIYNKEIDGTLLNNCIEHNYVNTLRVKKLKTEDTI